MEFNYREVLKQVFRERKARNLSYSLRAFARDLEVSTTALSDVLSGKRNFSDSNASKIAKKLSFSPSEYQQMLAEIKQKTFDTVVQQEIMQIADDEFNLISHWYYFAILTMSQQKNVRADEDGLAYRLGISRENVSEAIDALARLGLLQVKNGKLKRTSLPLRTTTDIPSYAIRNYHKENLDIVRHSLDNTPIDLREISSMNLNIDPKKMKIAKKLIFEFKEKFTNEMEKTSPKEVYTLAVHFFPANLKKDT